MKDLEPYRTRCERPQVMGETKQGIASPTVKQGNHNASNGLLIQVERKSQLADETAQNQTDGHR